MSARPVSSLYFISLAYIRRAFQGLCILFGSCFYMPFYHPCAWVHAPFNLDTSDFSTYATGSLAEPFHLCLFPILYHDILFI